MKPAVLLVLSAIATQAAGIPLCLTRFTIADNGSILLAQAIVTRVFADAGVRVEWLSGKQCKYAPSGTLYLILDATAPSHFKSETMGYAQPYSSGTAVHIFYDRIREDHRADFALVLGHAMAHEIGHVLQGVARHSESGIMKGLWSYREFGDMHLGRMRFAPEDILLLQLGSKDPSTAGLAARY
jgi:hypothetical protein